MNINDLAELMGVSIQEAKRQLQSDEPVKIALTEKPKKKIVREKEILINV